MTIASTAWTKRPSPRNLSRDGDSSPITPRPLWNGCCGKNIGCRRKTRFQTNVSSMLATKANTGSLVDVGGWTASIQTPTWSSSSWVVFGTGVFLVSPIVTNRTAVTTIVVWMMSDVPPWNAFRVFETWDTMS